MTASAAQIILSSAVAAWMLSASVSAGEISSPSKPALRYVIGLSPFLGKEAKDSVYRRIAGFLIEDMPINSTLALYDAYHLTSITEITIPEARAFASAKTRATQFHADIRKLRNFLAATPAPHDSPMRGMDQAIRLPQFLDFIEETVTSPHTQLIVLVIGSPLYMDPKEPQFSMVDGYFPSDGHLVATREQSVFGLRPRPASMKDFAVHFGFFGDPWVNQIHEEKVLRFWSLYLKQRGARLESFFGDLTSLFNAAHPLATPARSRPFDIDPSKTKIEMVRVRRDVGASDWITRDVLTKVQSGPPSSTKGPMKIGIRWQGALDLDLYASPNSRGETLFFENSRSAEGYYFKDHRASPDREYEFIEFESPVDVRQVEAMINFYEGASDAPPKGEIRIEFENKIFSGRFELQSLRGNQARSGRGQEKHWTQIDIPAILQLTQ